MYRALRRHYNAKKAIRKRNISRQVYHMDWYENLHQYSDNKVHCSCNLCRFRPVMNPDQKSMQDTRKIEKMKAREYLYKAGELATGDAITDSYYDKVV